MIHLVKPATWLAGYIPDLPTPFDERDGIDLTAFAKLCERQIEAEVSAIVVGETAGEASTLTPAEHDSIVRAAVKIARGRVRVVAGAGSNSTSQAIELTQRAEIAGADAVLSVVPYYNKPMQAGIHAHFQAIADSTALPIILHDIPSRTIRELSDDTLCGWRSRGSSSDCGMGQAMFCVRYACGHGCQPDSDCCPETTPPRWLSLPMAEMAAYPRYRMSRRNCVRPSSQTAGRDDCNPRDTCKIGWRR